MSLYTCTFYTTRERVVTSIVVDAKDQLEAARSAGVLQRLIEDRFFRRVVRTDCRVGGLATYSVDHEIGLIPQEAQELSAMFDAENRRPWKGGRG